MTGGLKGSSFQTKSTKGPIEAFRTQLADRLAETGGAESLQLLRAISDELAQELASGRQLPTEIGRLIDALADIRSPAEIKAALEKFSRLIAQLFAARSSVSMVCSLARSFHDRLILTAFGLAASLLEHEGKSLPDTPWALLVSGELGREESLLGRDSSFFLIYQDAPAARKNYFDQLAATFAAALSGCYPSVSRQTKSDCIFWHGTASEWHALAAGVLTGDKTAGQSINSGMTYAQLVETVADMRSLGGDPDFGKAVITTGRKQLTDSLRSEQFWQLAKDIAAMPVAIGIFGRFRILRSGGNRGTFDLKALALDPLAAAARILALPYEEAATSFRARMKAVLAAGNIGVALADRLLIAHQDFKREAIRIELSSGQESGGLFFDPEQLDDESRERFKAGLEDVTTLQRLVYQQLVEVE